MLYEICCWLLNAIRKKQVINMGYELRTMTQNLVLYEEPTTVATKFIVLTLADYANKL